MDNIRFSNTEDSANCKVCGSVFNGPYGVRKHGAMTFKSWEELHNRPHCTHLNDHIETEAECDDCKVAFVMES